MTLGEVHRNMTFTQYTAYGKRIATTHDSGRAGLINIVFQDGSQRLSVGDNLIVKKSN